MISWDQKVPPACQATALVPTLDGGLLVSPPDFIQEETEAQNSNVTVHAIDRSGRGISQ